jgi:phospholipase C
MSDDEAHLERLQQVEHLVVVMMENRSFDHMLGYLTTDGMPDVEGLTGAEFNVDRNGKQVPIHAFDADANAVMRSGEALRKALDPDHSKHGVATQLGPGYPGHEHPDRHNGGFVQAFVETRKAADNIPPELWSVPMGHYTAKDLPTYDFLARNYAVCDHWHSSVPGDTWPNRLFSLAGREGDKVKLSPLEALKHLLPGSPALASNAPIYDVPTFTHHLKDEQWRWYSHDPATLRAADGRFRDFAHIRRDNFGFFDRKGLSVVTQAGEALIVGRDSFLDDAAKGQLRDVSWIDPNFIDLNVLDPNSNDDHPPSDIRAGQAFILQIYEALVRSPNWDTTLLVIIYDEHGGFYDHVQPPRIQDDSGYATLGVRVPALLVGPMAAKAVCHDTFDHTSLIKTILRRFARDPDGALAQMSQRVRNAAHLGAALTDAPRADIPDHDEVQQKIDAWRTKAREARQAAPAPGPTVSASPSPSADGAGQPLILHDFQQDIVAMTHALRLAGMPPGQP